MDNYNFSYKYRSCFGEMMGLSHVKTNTPCQDKALCILNNGMSIAVLSDGCGSAELAHYGSNITVNSIGNLLQNSFDEIYNCNFGNIQTQIEIRKRIVMTIIDAQCQFVKENPEIFEEYRLKNQDDYNKFIANGNIPEEFFLKTLNATLLFFAEKDGKYLMGMIGDGVLGAIIDDKIKIVLEEKKTENINGTFYPSNIYGFATDKKDDKWYLHSSFQLKKPTNVEINGIILTTDGVEAIFERVGDNFHKRYANPAIIKFLNRVVEMETNDLSNKMLYDDYLPRFVSLSPSRDDCGICVLVKEDFVINECVIKEYPRPVIDDDKEDEQNKREVIERGTTQKHEDVTNVNEHTNNVEYDEYCYDNSINNEVHKKFFVDIFSSVIGKSIYQILDKVEKTAKSENVSFVKLMEVYKIILDNIISEGKICFLDEERVELYSIIIYADDKLYIDDEGNLRR